MIGSHSPKRVAAVATILLATITVSLVAGSAAEARRMRVMRRGRSAVVVHSSFPLHRKFPTVIIHPVHSRTAFVTPVRFFPPVVWKASIVTSPAPETIVWEDSDTFTIEDGWTEISLGVNDRGRALLLRLTGIARFDFGEIVFGNGDVQVIDFNAKMVKTGTFDLLDFKDGREVSYVRLLGKSESETSIVSLRMLK